MKNISFNCKLNKTLSLIDHNTLEKYGWTSEPMQITECTYGLENHSLKNRGRFGKIELIFENYL